MAGREEEPGGAPLVLASASPQRRDILEALGVRFSVRPADVEERTDGDPLEVAADNALLKARAVAQGAPRGALILGSDTVIVDRTGGAARAVGKPRDAREAADMLRRWSGTRHEVASSAAVVRAGDDGEPLVRAVDTTAVHFRVLEASDVDWYVGTGEWEGRAGGYAIQRRGSLLVAGVEGDWWTVVGLPVALLARELPGLLRGEG